MNKWELILIASAISFVLRSLPAIVFRQLRIPENGDTYKFLNYAALSIMGGIIYSALYGDRFYHQWAGHFETPQLLKLALVPIAFVLAARTRGIFKTLAICVGGYAIVLAMGYL
ncbi:AzlD domain-containing protein [Paraherbaspirillum soli]|uniref:AzlD domain-containing protein n=1 Tax=Paraherbaspirillum soli TaxID=631222 RepID=A0ABW0M8Q5_9BURK